MAATGYFTLLITGLLLMTWMEGKRIANVKMTCKQDEDKICLPLCQDSTQGQKTKNTQAPGCRICQQSEHLCINAMNKSCLKENCELCHGPQNDSHKICKEQNLTCIKDFYVAVNASSFTVNAGSKLELTCDHNLPNTSTLIVRWYKISKKAGIEVIPENKTKLNLKDLFRKDQAEFYCGIWSDCGILFSSKKRIVVKDNSMIVIVTCGVVAVVFVLVLALGMKLLLKKDIAQTKRRRNNHNNPNESNVTNSTVTTVASIW
ncbi:hypothetical protein AGOR_G00072520 [Albula goreensis]|uniref:Ig-like domain-containing protein n=1 Tax=Albula goreensis TaxID=1534307 RepID=A0A8T3DRL8_9TELE|nr:hypothetical protein AGOR_G00072520 [Albula goreensis]